MTRFLNVAAVRGLVLSVGMEPFIAKLAEYLRADFVRWDQFAKTPRTANYFPNGVLELMPISDHTHYCFKYVNGHPRNTHFRFPTVMAFSVFAEVEFGRPLLLAEATLCTAIRTAATSALAAKTLGNTGAKTTGAKTMAMIGCGAQSEFQALAFKVIVGIDRIQYFDIDPAAMNKFEENMKSIPGLETVPFKSVLDAVHGAEIVTLATALKTHAAVLSPSVVRPGMHINAIGGDSPGKTELHPDVMHEARVFVEYEPQTRHEGDVQQMTPDFPVTELWKVLAGIVPGRRSAEEVTVFDSVGFALEDFSTMRLLYDLAEEADLGEQIDLIANPSDPKNLYGFLMNGAG